MKTAELNNKHFLVTGGAGFIGSHIVEYLLNYGAAKVRVLDNLSTGYRENISTFETNNRFEFINGDIRDFEACIQATKGIDFVLHQAALGSVQRSISDPITTNNVNINGFLNILKAAVDNKIKKIVFASSSSVYGDNRDDVKIESRIGMPLSPYAVTKQTNELYAAVFSEHYGIETAGLRYFNVFGPRQNPNGPYAAVVPLFIEAIIKNKVPTIFGNGEQTRDFTYVDNVVQANVKALFTQVKNKHEIYNIACGETTSVNQIWAMLKKCDASEIKAFYAPERNGEIKDSLADITRAKEQFGYDPTIKIDEGLSQTYNWYKQKHL